LLLVRAPWTTVPAFSVAFWALGWWWLPLGSRSRLLAASLVLFGVLALLRFLPKHAVAPPPGYDGPASSPLVTGPLTGEVPRLRSRSSLQVVGVVLALLVPLPLWPHVPGGEMAFHTTSARLAAWRDALPPSYEPLLPLPHFGAYAPGLPTLAADVALLSGLDPGPSVALAAQLATGMLLLGLYALLATRLRPSIAALGALLGLAAAPVPTFLEMWGEGGPVLALALLLPAATLLLEHASKPSAVGAGVLLAAALLAQPFLAVMVGMAVAGWVAWRRTTDEGHPEVEVSQSQIPRRTVEGWAPRDAGPRRLALAFAVALVLAGPGLLRLARALSISEAADALGGIKGGELMGFVTGLALLGLAVLLAHLLGVGRSPSRVLTGALVAVSTGMLLVGVHGAPAAGQLAPETLRALARLESEGRPLEAVCAPRGVLDWVPALGGRIPGWAGKEGPKLWLPYALREEAARTPRPGCTRVLADPPEER
jgi:hypothetical protein